MRVRVPSLLGLAMLWILPGCTSVESTYVGEPRVGSCYKGMPIVAEKPKWRIVRTRQITYGLLSKSEPTDTSTVLTIEKVWDETKTDSEVVNKAYMFSVDVKRPFAGTAKWDFDFPEPHASGKQYYFPKKVHGDVDDKTLSQVGETFKTVIGALSDAKLIGKPGEPTAGAIPSDAGVHLLREQLVRIDVYDLEACSALAPEGLHVFSREYPRLPAITPGR